MNSNSRMHKRYLRERMRGSGKFKDFFKSKVLPLLKPLAKPAFDAIKPFAIEQGKNLLMPLLKSAVGAGAQHNKKVSDEVFNDVINKLNSRKKKETPIISSSDAISAVNSQYLNNIEKMFKGKGKGLKLL